MKASEKSNFVALLEPDRRMLTAEQLRRLAEVPTVVESLANATNPRPRRACQHHVRDFTDFVDIHHPDKFRPVTHAPSLLGAMTFLPDRIPRHGSREAIQSRAFGEGAGGVAVEDCFDDAEFCQCGRLGIVQEYAHDFQCVVEQFIEIQQFHREPAGDLLGVLRSRVAVRREYGLSLSLCEPRDARHLGGVEPSVRARAMAPRRVTEGFSAEARWSLTSYSIIRPCTIRANGRTAPAFATMRSISWCRRRRHALPSRLFKTRETVVRCIWLAAGDPQRKTEQ